MQDLTDAFKAHCPVYSYFLEVFKQVFKPYSESDFERENPLCSKSPSVCALNTVTKHRAVYSSGVCHLFILSALLLLIKRKTLKQKHRQLLLQATQESNMKVQEDGWDTHQPLATEISLTSSLWISGAAVYVSMKIKWEALGLLWKTQAEVCPGIWDQNSKYLSWTLITDCDLFIR